MAVAAQPFVGFTPSASQSLTDLAQNSDRACFQPRKADYERLLKEPLKALCVALADRAAARSIPLDADPKRSPFRIYRDPAGYPPDHPMAETFRWKDVVFGRRLSDAEVCLPGLPNLLVDGYATALTAFPFLATLR